MKWISVKDRLPEKEELVLLFLNSGNATKITTGKIYAGDVRAFNGEFCIGFDEVEPDFLAKKYVTHWMPLPEPPEVITDAET